MFLVSRYILTTVFIAFVCKYSSVSAQESYKNSSQEVLKLITETLKNYSVDDEIVNGFVYPVPDSRIKGDPYLTDQWNNATLFINNKKYTNFLIKYDLTIDDIILKAEIGNGVQRLVELNKFQIDSFLVGGSLFVSSRYILSEENGHNYFEQIYKGRYSLYKNYNKVFIREYNSIAPYGRYSDLRTNMFLFDGNKLIKVNKYSAFIKCFDKEKQKDIKLFMKKNRIKFKDASNNELRQLMEFSIKTISN